MRHYVSDSHCDRRSILAICGARREAIHSIWEARLRALVALLALALSVAAPVLPARAADGARPLVTDARIGVHDTTTRFVLALTAPATFHVFLLADPYRAVIDLPDVDWRLPADAQGGRGLITARRYGQFRPGLSRVVLNLSGPVTLAKSFSLPPIGGAQNRIVIDLKPTSRAAFLAAVRGTEPPPPAPAPLTRAAVPPPPKHRPADRKLIAVDPGHGGIDPGTIGVGHVFEKNVTLAMARVLQKALRDTGRYDAMLTRNKDQFIELRDRIRIAQQAGADLFISLHADSISERGVRGASVYTLSETSSDAEAAALAAKENRADALGGVDLSAHSQPVAQILIELTQRVTMNASTVFARDLVRELHGVRASSPADPPLCRVRRPEVARDPVRPDRDGVSLEPDRRARAPEPAFPAQVRRRRGACRGPVFRPPGGIEPAIARPHFPGSVKAPGKESARMAVLRREGRGW